MCEFKFYQPVLEYKVWNSLQVSFSLITIISINFLVIITQIETILFASKCAMEKMHNYTNANDGNKEKVSSFVPTVDAQREVYKRIVIVFLNEKKRTRSFCPIKKIPMVFGSFY